MIGYDQHGEIGSTRTLLLHGDKNRPKDLFEGSRSPLGEYSTHSQVQMKKSHMNTSLQQLLTLPDTPWQHSEKSVPSVGDRNKCMFDDLASSLS